MVFNRDVPRAKLHLHGEGIDVSSLWLAFCRERPSLYDYARPAAFKIARRVITVHIWPR